MNKELIKTCTRSVCIPLLLVFSQFAAATNNFFDTYRLKSGVHACGGNHRTSSDGTNYAVRNFNNNETINIDRVVVFDADGVVLFNFPTVDPFPAGFNPVLAPFQSTRLRTQDFFTVAPSAEPIQTHIQWSVASGTPALAPRIHWVRFAGSRHSLDCSLTRFTR